MVAHFHHGRFGLAGLLVGIGLMLAGCQENVDFTRKPIEDVEDRRQTAVKSPVFVVSKFDGGDVVGTAVSRLPEQIIRVRNSVSKAACVKRNGRRRCAAARVTGDVIRDGEPRIAGTSTGFELLIPMRYKFDIRGGGVAREVKDTVAGTLLMKATYTARMNNAWQPEVRFSGDVSWDDTAIIPVLEGRMDIARSIERKLKSRFRSLARDIEGALDTSKMQKAVADSWRHIHYPIQIMNKPDIWLRGEPSAIKFGGMGVSGAYLEFRVAIISELKTFVDDRPVPLIAQPVPELNSEPINDPMSHLPMPVELPYDELNRGIKAAFDERGPIKSTSGGRIKGFKVTDTRLFPLGGRLALAVDLEAETDSLWSRLTGTVYLSGTPHVAKGKALLDIRVAEFTAPTSAPSLFEDGQFIVPEKPFVETFRKGMQISLKERFASVIVRANDAMRTDFANGYTMRGRFDDLKVHSLEPQKDGLRINLDLVGALSIYPLETSVSAELGSVDRSSAVK